MAAVSDRALHRGESSRLMMVLPVFAGLISASPVAAGSTERACNGDGHEQVGDAGDERRLAQPDSLGTMRHVHRTHAGSCLGFHNAASNMDQRWMIQPSKKNQSTAAKTN